MNSRGHYDVAIIGAGLSGLAAGIRVAHFGKRVCIFERHNAPGGLNSFYSLEGRKFDVGLHAVTNYVGPGVKGSPLGTLLRQLRIGRDELELCQQKQSRIAFGPRGETALRFSNDCALLEAEVARVFPAQIDGFRRLVQLVRDTDYAEDAPETSARSVVRRHVGDPVLEDMLLCPALMYGGAQEYDLDFKIYAVLFRAILLEGLARPFEGIRAILRLLLERYRASGGERRMKCGVRRILARGHRAAALVLDSGEEVTADHVLSSIGAPETAALLDPPPGGSAPPAGVIAFVETITVFDRAPAAWGWGGATIVFFNDSDRLHYGRPEGQVDVRSGVICIPNNFDFGPDRKLPEGLVRATCLANYDRWAGLPEEEYRADKRRWYGKVLTSARRFLPPAEEAALSAATVATDMFTPRTVTRFTGRLQGAIYGSAAKVLDGRTSLSNLHLCGADQGLVGIVGAMLSGITMANRHVLQKG